MSSQNMPPAPERWAYLINYLMRYRGSSSAEALALKYGNTRLKRMTIRRIISLDKLVQPGSPGWDLKLTQLAGMLNLPFEALRLAYYGDVRALERLPFDVENGDEVKRFILEQLTAPNPGGARTRKPARG